MSRTRSAAPRATPNDVAWLDVLHEAHAANSRQQRATGLGCILLDRWKELRQRFGYRQLLDLRSQLADVVENQLGEDVVVEPLNEACLLVQRSPAEDLDEEMRALFERLATHEFRLGDQIIALTFSICVGRIDATETVLDERLVSIVSQAESLRDSGGNQMALFGDESTDPATTQERRRMLDRLMHSLRNDSIRVVFQPLLPTAGEEVRSFQMLPRLRDDQGGLIAAADFLPVARKAGLVATLDRWMLTAAIQMLERRYRDQSIRLFLSQSETLLAEVERRERLVGQLESADHLKGRLVLDFRLSDAMNHLGGAEALIAQLREAGVEVCLSMVDSHSNWSLLGSRLRCDYVRMAPAFVRSLAASPTLEHDLEALSAPARAAGIKIILPMIEDADAAATLWRKGVDYLQGNLIQAAEETIQLSG